MTATAVCLAALGACGPAEAPDARPACPTSAPAEVGGALKPTNIMEFDGVSFARRFGDAECEHAKGGGGRALVCRFTSPAVLEVKTAKGTYPFAPGIGQPATVTVRDGVASCAMDPKSAS